MPSIIKFRRGSTTPPILAAGEPAFVTADKSLYIGDGTANYRIGPNSQNLLLNGNLIAYNKVDAIDYVSPGSAIMVGGLYKFSCPSGSTYFGIRFPTNPQDGMVTFEGVTDQKVKIEYNIPYPSTSGYTVRPYEGQAVVLSFDLETTKAGTFNFGVGDGGVTYTKSYVSGKQRMVCPIPNWSDTGIATSYFSLIIADFNEAVANGTKIGNIKLERGSMPTPFVPNAMSYDTAIINQYMTRIVGVYRAIAYGPNDFWFSVPYNFNVNLGTPRRIIPNSFQVRSYQSGSTAASGFSAPVASLGNDYKEIIYTVTKTAHGLTDLSAMIDVTIDYRKWSS